MTQKAKNSKKKYSAKTGAKKSFKNIVVTMAIPALLFLANNLNEWVPQEYMGIVTPVAGFVTYFVKNWKENR